MTLLAETSWQEVAMVAINAVVILGMYYFVFRDSKD